MSFILLALVSVAAGKIIYVDDDAVGANNGTSWENAYVYLQDALADADTAEKPVEIRVAQGVYKPNEGLLVIPEKGWRDATFQLINGVSLKGGYAGFGESDANKRDIKTYETILSGDIDGDDVFVSDPCDLFDERTRGGNSRNVVTSRNTDATTVLEGVTITGGYIWVIIRNGGPAGGAGMLVDSGSPRIIDCSFTGNVTGNSGGGLLLYDDSNPTLINCKFTRNYAVVGGGMSNSTSNPILLDCIFENNYARREGGGMSNSFSDPVLTNCMFSSNLASGRGSISEGGGMYNRNSNPILINCEFINNRAVALSYYRIMNSEGGGIYNNSSSPVLNNCEFDENLADYGGGICNADESNILLTNCIFRSNSASYGGGLFNPKDCNSILIDCKFIDNTVIESGGGISNGSSDTTLINCLFNGNKAEDLSLNGIPPSRGGGMITGGNPLLNNCTFQKNFAVDGAGICITGGPKLIWCNFTGNSAENDGGGICVEGTSSEPYITNCIFTGNFANRGGGVFFTWGAKMAMANCTFASNLASTGRSMACDPYLPSLPGYIELTNCILWDGENAIFDPDPYALSSAITYSNIQGGWPGEGNIDVDPLFVEPGYWAHIEDPNVIAEPNDPNAVWVDGDYRLKSQAGRWDPNSRSWVQDDVTSPCIDSGDPNNPIQHEPFPNGGIINMGAYGGTAEASKSYFSE